MLLFLSNRSAHAASPVVISQCGNINQPGNYVLTSNVVLHLPEVSGNGDCLVICSSNVTIDLQGYKITADCPIIAPPSCLEFGPVGGTGVDVLNGTTRVSISNGGIDNYYSALTVADATRLFVSNIHTNAPAGITLTNVTGSIFAQIAYQSAIGLSKFGGGYLAYSSGGGYNAFVNLLEREVSGVRTQGIVISNSRHNLIDGAVVNFFAYFGNGSGILLTENSGGDVITDNKVLSGDGIQKEKLASNVRPRGSRGHRFQRSSRPGRKEHMDQTGR
jgi:hypothetical protein